MTDVIGAGAADGQQISICVSTQVLALDGSLGNIEGEVAAEGCVADDLVAMLLVESSEVERQLCLLAVDDAVLVVVGVGCALLIGVDRVEGFPLLREIFLCQLTLVELVDPLGQFVHIEGAGDESSCLVVEPIGTVGMMSGRKDGSASAGISR